MNKEDREREREGVCVSKRKKEERMFAREI